MNPFTPEDIAQIKSLADAGLMVDQIAERMGWPAHRSLKAIQDVLSGHRRRARGVGVREQGCTGRTRVGNWA